MASETLAGAKTIPKLTFNPDHPSGADQPPENKVGFMYMLRGDGGASNTNPYATKADPNNNWIKTGSHVMIVGSGAKMLDGYPRTAKADPTKPYVMWPGSPYEHLMLPVH